VKGSQLAARFRSLPATARALIFLTGAVACLVFGGLSALTVLLWTLALLSLEGREFDSLGLQLSARRLTQLIGGLILGMLLMSAQVALFRMVSDFHWERGAGVGLGSLFAGALFYLASSASEELAFRGYGFQRLVEAAGPIAAQVITAALFAAYHVALGMPVAAAVLFTGLGSILYGYAFLRTKGVALPIGIHAGWNFIQENLAGISGRSQPGYWNPVRAPGDAGASFAASLGILLIVTLAGAAVVWQATRRYQASNA
jgi:membrane protease YdiL (CAAX protease family)